jgi:Recombination endonuclease VII
VCGVTKSIDDFSLQTKAKDGRQGACKVCDAARHATPERRKQALEYARRNREAANERTRRWNTKKTIERLGITPSEWSEKIAVHTACEICGQNFSPKNPRCADHCHTTGTVRGALCRACNLVLGYARDSAHVLRKAADYLGRRS